MEIRFMKQEALDTLKNSLSNTFTNYFTESDGAWIEKIYPTPFGKFRDVPDFELAPLDTGLTVGEMDFENCKRVYENFKFLTESQAADERLWAGLCHDVFYDYVRRRFGYDANRTDFSTTDDDDVSEKFQSATDKEITRLKNRFFLNGEARVKLVQNPLARYWWTGRAFYDETNRTNHFEKLDLIGAKNFYTKIFSLMSRTFAANPRLLNGVIKFFKHFREKNIDITSEKHLRPALSEVNKAGGARILDCLTETEIAAIMIEYVEKILSHKNPRTAKSGSGVEIFFPPKKPVVDTRTIKPVEKIPAPKKPVVDTRAVEFGNEVKVVSLDNGTQRNYKINKNFERRHPKLFKEISDALIGKKINSVVTLRDGKFTITDIQ